MRVIHAYNPGKLEILSLLSVSLFSIAFFNHVSFLP